MRGLIDPDSPLFFDTETTGLSPRSNTLVALQFHQPRKGTWIIDMRHFPSYYWTRLEPIFTEQSLIVGHNLKFDMQFVRYNIQVYPKKIWDTFLAEKVIAGGNSGEYSLKAVAKAHGSPFDMSKDEREWFFDLDKNYERWDADFPASIITYMEHDVEVLPYIFYPQRDDWFAHHPRQLDCLELENRTAIALSHVELSGVPINADEWMKVINEEDKRARELEGEIIQVFGAAVLAQRIEEYDQKMVGYMEWERARDECLEELKYEWSVAGNQLTIPEGGYKGWGDFKTYEMKRWRERNPNPGKPKLNKELNINSHDQLLEAFGALGIEAKDTTAETLERLSEEHEPIGLLLEYKKAQKFVSSFGEELLRKRNPNTNRIHPSYNQIVDTDRMSCSNPNWQQIPSRSETGKRLRRAVVAPDGWVFLDADYSAQELAIAAEITRDANLLDLFAKGLNPHKQTAKLMFNLSDTDNPKEIFMNGIALYDVSKQINYAIFYGATKYRLAKLLNTDYDTAQGFLDLWFQAYPGVRGWREKRMTQHHRGEWYSDTLHGWRRRYEPLGPEPNWQRDNDWRQKRRDWFSALGHLQNQWMNTPIQGTGAGITKLGLTNFFERGILNNDYLVPSVQVVAVVHDEILVLAREERSEEFAKLLGDCMDEAERHYLPTVQFPPASVHIGKTWEH